MGERGAQYTKAKFLKKRLEILILSECAGFTGEILEKNEY
jgi:hypothetical protein